jgi:hypothetical protein
MDKCCCGVISLQEAICRFYGTHIKQTLVEMGISRPDVIDAITEALTAVVAKQVHPVAHIEAAVREVEKQMDDILKTLTVQRENMCNTCFHRHVCHHRQCLQDFTKSRPQKIVVTFCPQFKE